MISSILSPSIPPKVAMSWEEYDKAIVEFFFEHLQSSRKPDFIIGAGKESFAFGNALSRLFDTNVGYSVEGSEQISVIGELRGKILLVGKTSDADFERVEAQIQNSKVESISRAFLFKNEVSLPDDCFKEIDLSPYTAENLKDADIQKLAQELFAPYKTLGIKKTDPSVLNVSWDEYNVLIIELALKFKQMGLNPDEFRGIGRGGLRIAKALADLFRRNVGVVMASSYKGKLECGQSRLIIAKHVSAPKGGENPALIDDLVDSGVTLGEISKQYYDIITAVLYKKAKTKVDPNIHVRDGGDQWIVLPDEIFERLNLCEVDSNSLKGRDIKQLTNELFEKLSEHSPKELLSQETLQKIFNK